MNGAAQLFQAWGPWLGLLLGTLPWLVFLRDGEKSQKKERLDLAAIAQDAVKDLIKDLREELDRGNKDRDQLRHRLEEVEHELADFRRKHDAMIADKDAELTLLRGENRQLLAMLESYRRLMKANGIEPPPVTQQFWSVPTQGKPPELEDMA